MYITVQQIKGEKYKLELDEILELTVYEVKSLIEVHWPELETESQKLIFKGKILDDEAVLGECGVKHGSKLIVVKPKKKKSPQKKKTTVPPASQTVTEEQVEPAPEPSSVSAHPPPPDNPPATTLAPSNPTTQTVPPAIPQMPNMMGMPGMGNNGQMPNLQQMQQQMMQNPEMMQQMMQNPMMQSMMNNMMQNPEMLRSMFDGNPQLRQIMDQNPAIRHMLQDPDTLQQALSAVQNPEVYQEMLRNQDRALANISNMPGGFNALSRMYNQVQAPMEDAIMGMQEQREQTVITDVDTSTGGPTSNAMPNPWGNNSQQPSPARSQAQPTNQNRPNPFANMLGNPNMFANMMNQNNGASQNPMMNMMQQFAQPQAPSNPREAYQNQLAQLVELGFQNEQENINALVQAGGSVMGAVNILLTNRGQN